MWAMFLLGLAILGGPFKSKRRLEAEHATLRHQLNVLRRKVRGRVRLTNCDRWFFVHLYRWFSSALQVVTIVCPETVVHWHRVGFRRYWPLEVTHEGRAAANRDRAPRLDQTGEH
jgi:hypothetical protein